jgi:hypothetical protein
MPYPGDSDGKRLSRLALYLRCADLFSLRGRPGGKALVLAGNDGADVPLLRRILRWPEEDIVVVDYEAPGLLAAKEKAQKIITHQGDIRRVIPLAKWGFANFDFMGHLDGQTNECLKSVRSRTRIFGVVACTFFRGREKKGSEAWGTAQAIARQLPRKKRRKEGRRRWGSGVVTRWAGYHVYIGRLLGKNVFDQVFFNSYSSQTSPMGIHAFQSIPISLRGPNWKKTREQPDCYPAFIHTTDPSDILKALVVETHKLKVSSKVLAEVLNLTPGTVNAWCAHGTMGTYKIELLKHKRIQSWAQRAAHHLAD